MKRIPVVAVLCFAALFIIRTAISKAPVLSAQAAPPTGAGRNQSGPAAQSGVPSLQGVVDVHTHSAPDNQERAIDSGELARLAKSRGMRGIVLKNHDYGTAPVAFMIRKFVPGIEVFGVIALNLPEGGINVGAVRHMTELTGGYGRVVYMPTTDAEHQRIFDKEKEPSVSIARNGDLLPAVKEIIGLIAKHNLVLATGHSSPTESLMLIREARRQGVQHIVVTHPLNPAMSMSMEQMQEAAKNGAFLEITARSVLGPEIMVKPEAYVDAIRKLGPDSIVISSDLGQKGAPLPPDGLMTLLKLLSSRGITQQELTRMVKDNPVRLMGLPPL